MYPLVAVGDKLWEDELLLLCVVVKMVEAELEAEEVLSIKEEIAMVEFEAVVEKLGEDTALLELEAIVEEMLEERVDDDAAEGVTLADEFDNKVGNLIGIIDEFVGMLDVVVTVLNELDGFLEIIDEEEAEELEVGFEGHGSESQPGLYFCEL